MTQTYITLNNGANIPQFGLGVYMISGDANTKQACLEALKLVIVTLILPMPIKMNAA